MPWGAPMVSACFFPFYDNDFRYLDDPNNTQYDWLDPIKRIHLGDNWLLSLGGEERLRYMYEINSRLTGRFNDYLLQRTRLYGDLWYKDWFRVYVEFLDAQSYGQELAPLNIDIDRTDLLNAFVDMKLGTLQDQPIYARVGRQELVYGSQRLISPLDWANTQRTFEGAKIFWHSENLDVDGFWVRPMNVYPNRFDAGDANRQFAGLWTTYRPTTSSAMEFYYLYFDADLPLVPRPPPTERGGQNVNTFGARYVGDYEKKLLWDFEGMWQFGERVNHSISAGAATAGLGWHVVDAPLNPTFWIYYDVASGSNNGVNQGGTFNQLFPFGHYYFGFLDLVGRQNIQDLNLHVYTYPTNWIVTGLQTHFFYLYSGRDALYSAGGAVERTSPRGNAGVHVGDEIDLTANFHLTFHQDIFVGYSVLFSGEFIRNTGNPTSPQLFYVQYSYKW
jgi:Alginate export